MVIRLEKNIAWGEHQSTSEELPDPGNTTAFLVSGG